MNCGRGGSPNRPQAIEVNRPYLPAVDHEFTRSLRNGHRVVTQAVNAVDMDIDALHSVLLSITLVSEKLRSAREILAEPEGCRFPIGQLVGNMENDLRIAKATLAGELGFGLCPQCWPPEFVITHVDGRISCTVCGEVPQMRAA